MTKGPHGEMVDTADLKSADISHPGSSPGAATKTITDYIMRMGYNAWWRGDKVKDCPFSVGTARFIRWRMGYRIAKEEK